MRRLRQDLGMVTRRSVLIVLVAVTALLVGRSTTGWPGPTSVAASPRWVPRVVSADQLAAYGGVGVPSGWMPADSGHARLWVPGSWVLDDCAPFPGAEGVVWDADNVECRPSIIQPPFAQNMVLLRNVSSPPSPQRFARVVHGYRLYRVTPPTGWLAYDVPQLGVRILLRGRLRERVLATLAPGAWVVALTHTTTPTAGWHTVSVDGITVSVPRSWQLTSPKAICSNGTSPSAPELQHANANATYRVCTERSTSPLAAALRYGAFIVAEPASSGDPGTLIGQINDRSARIGLYSEANDPKSIDVVIVTHDSKTEIVISLFIGNDARTIGTIIASIHPNR